VTILRLRHLLEKHDLGAAMLDMVNHYLDAQGIRIISGTIVDTIIIHARSSTKNRRGDCYPEMHQTRNVWGAALLGERSHP
jgi:IS5 family transposase